MKSVREGVVPARGVCSRVADEGGFLCCEGRRAPSSDWQQTPLVVGERAPYSSCCPATAPAVMKSRQGCRSAAVSCHTGDRSLRWWPLGGLAGGHRWMVKLSTAAHWSSHIYLQCSYFAVVTSRVLPKKSGDGHVLRRNARAGRAHALIVGVLSAAG